MMGWAVPGLVVTVAGLAAAGDGWADCTMAPLMLAGFAPVAGGVAALVSFAGLTAGTGAGGVSISSFWKSNTAICWALPSSINPKSPFLRSSTTLPDLSFTVTSMIT